MSVYLDLGHKDFVWLNGIYSSEQELLAAQTDTDPYFEKKDVCYIDEETGEITFSDGSRLKPSARCEHIGWSGYSGDIELDYEYEPAATNPTITKEPT